MRDASIAKNSKKIRILGLCAVVCLLAYAQTSCNSQVSAQQLACTCPAPQKCEAIQQPIQFNQLDPAVRARLKSEFEAELKEETKTRWTQEFEAEARAKLEAEIREKYAQAAQAAREKSPENDPSNHAENSVKPDRIPPTQPIERDSGGMKITRHIFTTRVEHRQPVSDRESFYISDSNVFCYVEISSPESRDRMVTIRFTHSTGLAQSYTLPVSQSPSWRTWAKLNLTKSMTGTWLCEVFNEDNVLLASKPFVVVD